MSSKKSEGKVMAESSSPKSKRKAVAISSSPTSKSDDIAAGAESRSRKRKAVAISSSPMSKFDDIASYEDAMAILNGVVEFRSTHDGANPTPSTMGPLFESLSGSLHTKLASVDQLYNRFRTLKRKYQRVLKDGAARTPADRAFCELSFKAWKALGEGEEKQKEKKQDGKEKGKEKRKKNLKEKAAAAAAEAGAEKGKEKVKEKAATAAGAGAERGKEKATATADADDDVDDEEEEKGEEEEEEDASVCFKYLAEEGKKCCELMGLSFAALELGLKRMDRAKAAALERKWTSFYKAELKNEAKSRELEREICITLAAVLNKKP